MLFVLLLLISSSLALEEGKETARDEGTDMDTFNPPPPPPPPHPDCVALWQTYNTATMTHLELLALLNEMCGKYCFQDL